MRRALVALLLVGCGSAGTATIASSDAGPVIAVPDPAPSGMAISTAPEPPPPPPPAPPTPPPPPPEDAGMDVTEAGSSGALGKPCDVDAGTGCPGNYTCWAQSVPAGTYGTCVIVCGGPAGHDAMQVTLCGSYGLTCESMTAIVDGCWRN